MGAAPDHDYLKYWRVVKYFAKRKYQVSSADLDMLLFLYSEKYFNKTTFKTSFLKKYSQYFVEKN